MHFACCSIEDDFCAWKKELWPALCTEVGREVPKDVENAILARQYKLVQFTKPPSKYYAGEHGRHRSIPYPRSLCVEPTRVFGNETGRTWMGLIRLCIYHLGYSGCNTNGMEWLSGTCLSH